MLKQLGAEDMKQLAEEYGSSVSYLAVEFAFIVARKAEQEYLRQIVNQIMLNCYLVWAEVDGEYKENICLSVDFLNELTNELRNEGG